MVSGLKRRSQKSHYNKEDEVRGGAAMVIMITRFSFLFGQVAKSNSIIYEILVSEKNHFPQRNDRFHQERRG